MVKFILRRLAGRLNAYLEKDPKTMTDQNPVSDIATAPAVIALPAADPAPTRAVAEVQADLKAARASHEASVSALSAAEQAEQAARGKVAALIAEGRQLIDAARADFAAVENYLSGVVGGVEPAEGNPATNG